MRELDPSNNAEDEPEERSEAPANSAVEANRGIEGFVVNEALSRFDLPPAPTHLLEWERSDTLQDSKRKISGSRGIPSRYKHKSPTGGTEDNEQARKRLINRFNKQLDEIANRGGRRELTSHRDALQKRLSEEKGRLKKLCQEIPSLPVVEFCNLILNMLCKPRIDEGGEDAKIGRTETPRGEPVLNSTFPTGFKLERYQIGGPYYGLKIRVSKEVLREHEIDPSALPDRELSVESMPSTWKGLAREVRKISNPSRVARQASEEVVDLLRFRLELARRHLWAYDILGESPQFTGEVVVPASIRSKKTALQRALTASAVLQQCDEEGKSDFSSQSDLVREIESRTRIEERGVSPEAVLKGAKRILEELSHAETTGTAMISSLGKNGPKIRRFAEELGIDAPGESE